MLCASHNFVMYLGILTIWLRSINLEKRTGLVLTMTSHLKEMAKSIEAAQEDHNKALQIIRDILMYMDRTFIPSTHKTLIHELGLNLWRDNVIHTSKIQPRLQDTLLELLDLMRNIMNMFMDLGSSVHQEDFEIPFLEVSTDFYRGESQQFIECCDCGDYLKKAEKRLNEENYEAKITNVVEKEMIKSHMNRLVHLENSGLVNMIMDDKYEDLEKMYNLFRRVSNGLSIVRDVMISYIRDTGKQLVTDLGRLKDPVDFVHRLLDVKDKHDRIISVTFHNALNSSFQYFINLNPQSPEFVSLFVDDKLQKGPERVSEEDLEIVLDKVMKLFRYLREDLFEKYYRQHLAKRLQSLKTVSDNADRSLIVKLKTECGYQFTSKLEGMFTDMKTS
ncbi:Cullin-3A [Camellia lanceoleosa]|uniref:Cullin-3A n=1 Tax=Camellia lanceoleosa TaxID=1840588 RepID=A0ACC0H9N6_9ERIC|nr:Cullin-3A [Camellia lanceoleosa]